ncbi:MAG: RNA polymerase sigma factor RpoE [bacterium]
MSSSREADQALVEKVQAGDKKAFDLLVLKYQQRVVNIISRYIQDHSEVYDVAQETFIKAYRALSGFRGDSAFYTWLYRIATNTAKNHLASRGRRPPSSDVEAETAEQLDGGGRLRDYATPEHLVLEDEIASTIKQAVDELPEDLRIALTLRELEGLSYEEISQAMNCPIGTVRSRIFRAREAVDEKLKPLMS